MSRAGAANHRFRGNNSHIYVKTMIYNKRSAAESVRYADVFGGLLAALRVLLNDGNGVFTDGTTTVFPASARGFGFDIEAGDFDGDGFLELYLASRGSADILLRRQVP